VNNLIANWRDWVPVAGLAILAVASVVMWLRRRPSGNLDLEQERRAYVNRVGRIVEGRVLDVVDRARNGASEGGAASNGNRGGLFSPRRPAIAANAMQKLLYYSYSISGVSYETAQDVTGMEERLHLTRIAAGQIASVKYDPSNPSNSILLADDWSGLH
jgi:hypothetical protein